MFPARLIQEARAAVLPVFFSGQNGRLFHLISQPMALAEREGRFVRFVGKLSLTLRLSLLIREFARLSGKTLDVSVGAPVEWSRLEAIRDRKALKAYLNRCVFELATKRAPKRRMPFLQGARRFG